MQAKSGRRAALAVMMLALVFPGAAGAGSGGPGGAAVGTVFQAAGPNAASIQGAVDAFRNALGTLNPNNPGSVGSGRREINWDGVPDTAADPNPFPGDFFNTVSPRGAVFSTPGAGLLVSANAANPTNTPIEFGRLNAAYPAQFTTFSPQRLFSALPRGNVVLVRFFVPGSRTRALSRGFGAVFTDVDLRRSASLEFLDRRGRLLRRLAVPRSPGAGSLSFAGVDFGRPILARVRIVSGNVGLGRNDAPARGRDVVVMDDFIFGEPVAR